MAARDRFAEALGEDVELVPTTDVVEPLRAVKDDAEREAIRTAQAITDAAFDAILERFSVGVTEQQIARQLETAMRDAGADGLAFDSIVAFGENAAEPHHEPTHRTLEEGDVIKLDFGALAAGYHADMTRTVAFGSPPSELRKIHDIVRESQQAGIDAVKAGVPGSAVDAVSREVIERAGYGDAFVHSLGHGVGLEIHEAAELWDASRTTRCPREPSSPSSRGSTCRGSAVSGSRTWSRSTPTGASWSAPPTAT